MKRWAIILTACVAAPSPPTRHKIVHYEPAPNCLVPEALWVAPESKLATRDKTLHRVCLPEDEYDDRNESLRSWIEQTEALELCYQRVGGRIVHVSAESYDP